MSGVLPIPGEVAGAAKVMNGRFEAAVGVDEETPMAVRGTIGGETAVASRAVYGDLFNPDEVAEECAVTCDMYLAHLFTGALSPRSMAMSLFFQGVALGVVMERRRWEAREREGRGE